jgi:hypothetical protein
MIKNIGAVAILSVISLSVIGMASPFNLDITQAIPNQGTETGNPIFVKPGVTYFSLNVSFMVNSSDMFNITALKITGAPTAGISFQFPPLVNMGGLAYLHPNGADPYIAPNAFNITIPANAPDGDIYIFEIDANGITPINGAGQPPAFDAASASRTFIVVNRANISGYKINDTNGNGIWDPGEAGIQGWNIILWNATTGAFIASYLTNGEGFYQFQNLPQGSYNVSEEARVGWFSTNATSRVIAISGQDVINQNFTNRRASIYGMVLNASSGTSIPGAIVTADGMTSVTDNGGFYNISIAPGTYNVTASATGYNSASASVTVVSGATSTYNFTLTPTVATPINGTIIGMVINASSGTPIPGAIVTADGMTSVTDNGGIYNISIAPGTYNVTASATGYNSASANVTVVSGAISTYNFTLTPTVATPINGTIIGIVFNASSGVPIPGAIVTADGMSSVTGNGGFYNISIAPGTYNVTASATGYNSASANVTVASGLVSPWNFTLTAAGGTSVGSSTGNGTVFFNTNSGAIENLTAVNVSVIPEAPPIGANLYYGLFGFNITGIIPGSSVNLTLTFPNNLPAGTTYWKYGANHSPHWYTIPSTISDNKLTITLVDGGVGDDDLKANGVIQDPGGPSIPPTPIPSSPVKVTGGGWIKSPLTPKKNNDKATFAFEANNVSGMASGKLEYIDHVSGMNVKGNVTMLSVNNTTMTAIFSGIAKINDAGDYAYTVTVMDNGKSGKNDTFAISISGKPYIASGVLGGGNILMHDS